MTRINVVPPSELSNSHLGAEYRELPRVFGLVYEAMLRGEKPNDPRNPTEYVLGPGHVRFFYGKLAYLRRRYAAIVEERLARKQRVSFPQLPIEVKLIPDEWWGEYEPTPQALALNRARIAERTLGGRGVVVQELHGAEAHAAWNAARVANFAAPMMVSA